MPQALYPPGPRLHGPPGSRVIHALGERGYSFCGPGGVRREIASFSLGEREIWFGGRWHHEMRFGRLGCWWEVNGAWYFYGRPFEGAPAFVSEVEVMDDGLSPGAPAVVGAPAPAVAGPAPAVIAARHRSSSYVRHRRRSCAPARSVCGDVAIVFCT
jgi:hypothetical protein